MKRLLIIEDEPAILVALRDELSRDFQVFCSGNGKEGLDTALSEQPDLILLDVVLPGIDGFCICQELKKQGVDTSIIMVTARDQVIDKVRGLEAGADDYLTKPFSFDELKARINAVLRRKQAISAAEYDDGALKIDFKKFKALKKQKLLKLSFLEFKVLRFLISKKGELVSRDELLEHVWGYHISPATRTVDAHIVSLRKKLGRGYIVTVPKQGYRFEGKE